MRDTHLLVLVPNKVDGKAFHLNSLYELAKSPKTGSKTNYTCYSSYVKNDLGTKDEESHWVLMTRHVILESRDKTYDNQKALVASHASRSGIPYVLPKALEAATVILMHYVETGKVLYTDDKLGIEYAFTRCQEKVNKNQWSVTIGAVVVGGLLIGQYWTGDRSGVGCCWKF